MALEKVVNNGFGSYKASEEEVKPSWGVERVPFNGLVEATPGSAGLTYTLNSEDPRFLFSNGVGRWFYASQDDNAGNGNFNASILTIGTFIGTTGVTNQTVTGTLTINFFGTDLNLLISDGLIGGAGNSWSIAPVVNGTAGTTITRASGSFSPVLSNVANVRGNQVLPLGLNLTAGNHTVVLTISLNPASGQAVGAVLPLYGCEIVNEKAASTSSLMDISNGDIFSDGYRYRLDGTVPARPPVVPTAYSGSRGARVVSYVNPLTQIFESAITNVNAAQANLTSTDHTNEEIVRRINFREFGANSQFALTGGFTSRAFTLDDGTTTLSSTGSTNSADSTAVYLASANEFIDFTFVGTGLDVVRNDGITASGNNSTLNISIDGSSIGTITGIVNSVNNVVVPIVSGLPYGTHVLRILLPTGVANFHIGFSDFIIYGPAKPTIPASAVEIADYNLTANFVAAAGSTTPALNLDRVGSGTIRKMSTREFTYTNEAISGPSVDAAAISGFQINMENGNVPFFYTFYGTGCEFRFSTRTDKVLQFFIDQPTGSGNTATPLALTAANFLAGDTTTYTIQNGTAGSFNGATVPVTTNGQVFLDNTVDPNSGFRVTGLALGIHTIAVMGRTSSMAFRPRCVDVITPIHYQNPNLKVGSESIGDVRPDFANIAAENEVVSNLGEAKAWINYDPVNDRVLSSFNVSAVIESTSNASQAQIYFDKPFKDANYIAIATGGATSPGGIGEVVINTSFKEANYVRIQTENSAGTLGYFAAFFGELIDE